MILVLSPRALMTIPKRIWKWAPSRLWVSSRGAPFRCTLHIPWSHFPWIFESCVLFVVSKAVSLLCYSLLCSLWLGGLLLGSGPLVVLAWFCSSLLWLLWLGGLLLGCCTLLLILKIVASLACLDWPVQYLWALLRFFFLLQALHHRFSCLSPYWARHFLLLVAESFVSLIWILPGPGLNTLDCCLLVASWSRTFPSVGWCWSHSGFCSYFALWCLAFSIAPGHYLSLLLWSGLSSSLVCLLFPVCVARLVKSSLISSVWPWLTLPSCLGGKSLLGP